MNRLEVNEFVPKGYWKTDPWLRLKTVKVRGQVVGQCIGRGGEVEIGLALCGELESHVLAVLVRLPEHGEEYINKFQAFFL